MFAWKNTTAAVVGTSQGSPIPAICGRAFHGSADVESCATWSILPGNGNDAAITVNHGVTGTSTGTVTDTFPRYGKRCHGPECRNGPHEYPRDWWSIRRHRRNSRHSRVQHRCTMGGFHTP